MTLLPAVERFRAAAAGARHRSSDGVGACFVDCLYVFRTLASSLAASDPTVTVDRFLLFAALSSGGGPGGGGPGGGCSPTWATKGGGNDGGSGNTSSPSSNESRKGGRGGAGNLMAV